jgi:hypothetical protein
VLIFRRLKIAPEFVGGFKQVGFKVECISHVASRERGGNEYAGK